MRLTLKHLLPIKVMFHLLAVLPFCYLLFTVLSERAGGDPVQYIIHYTGMGALNALVAVLLVSPIAKRFKLGVLMQTRRLLGLYVFGYASLHIFSFLSLDLLFEWQLLASEIIKRPYILVGASGYLILLLLAVTSFNRIRRKMGRSWQTLHNSIYLLALLAPIHFYWSVKSEVIEPSIYLGIFICLLIVRFKSAKLVKKTNVASKKVKVV